MRKGLYILIALLVATSAFGYLTVPYRNAPGDATSCYSDCPRGPRSVQSPSPVQNVFPDYYYPTFEYRTTCFVGITADPTDENFMAIASRQCKENNIWDGCYNSCMRKARDLFANIRQRPVTGCNYVAQDKVIKHRGESSCRSLMLDCGVLNAGLPTARFCIQDCKYELYNRCETFKTTRSVYSPNQDTAWAQYTRSYRSEPWQQPFAKPFNIQ